jgi:hypothetical protein
MTAATQTRAQFLKSAERSVSAENATLTARWGEAAGDTAQSSLLIEAAAATAELARQMTLLEGVIAEDGVMIEGVFLDLEGQTVRVDYTAPGDAGGAWFGGATSVDILVTRAQVDIGAGTTVIQGFIQL